MRIAVVAAELGPDAKAGGLADVISALPPALKRAGAEPLVIVPGYRPLLEHTPTEIYEARCGLMIGSGFETYRVLQGEVNRVPLFLIDHPGFFGRSAIYSENGFDYSDNLRRFIFFSRAAAGLATRLNPDVLQTHDWHTAACTIAARADAGLRPQLESTTSVFTIHNVAYQGNFDPVDFPLLGLDPSWFRIDRLEFFGRVSLMKGAIVTADGVSTVSPTYADESMHDPALGFGMDGVLRAKADHYVGILNGADYDEWDPAKDKFIGARYSPSRRSGKMVCLYNLREEFKLPHLLRTPVIGMVTRISWQKGLDLLAQALDRVIALDVQLVILAGGDPALEALFRTAQDRYPDRVRIVTTFDNTLAHRIQAGSDMFLMPSRYEPCGLTQMYALKYGTAPIVRAVGGLKDTVCEFDPATGNGNGFTFSDFSAEALIDAVRRAVAVFHRPNDWKRLIKNCFAADYSWDYAAGKYLEWFDKLRREQGGSRIDG
jgi:starch synthase